MNLKMNARYIANRKTQSRYRVMIGSTVLISPLDRNDDFRPSKTSSSFDHNFLQAVRPSVQSLENLSLSSRSIPSRDSVSLYFCLCEARGWFYSKRNVGCRETIARILHHCYSSFPFADSAAVFFAVSDSRVSFMNPILPSWVPSGLFCWYVILNIQSD